MKWKIKFTTCKLLAGLTALTFSACQQPPSIELLSAKVLDFPSASGIEFYKDTLFVFGDNATCLLRLNADYKVAGCTPYWISTQPFMSKEAKPDIESALIRDQANGPVLIGIGSMSGKNRWQTFRLLIGDDTLTTAPFFSSETIFKGIDEINIEGSTAFDENILLCNRANLSTRKNHLLLWNGNDSVLVKEITLPETNGVAGLSGLYYVKEKDVLLFTASEEETLNAYEDGAIGESYLGWITNFSRAWKADKIKTDNFLMLSSFDQRFVGQKIESVCLESVTGNKYTLHLAADNDNGKSVLFKVTLLL